MALVVYETFVDPRSGDPLRDQWGEIITRWRCVCGDSFSSADPVADRREGEHHQEVHRFESMRRRRRAR